MALQVDVTRTSDRNIVAIKTLKTNNLLTNLHERKKNIQEPLSITIYVAFGKFITFENYSPTLRINLQKLTRRLMIRGRVLFYCGVRALFLWACVHRIYFSLCYSI